LCKFVFVMNIDVNIREIDYIIISLEKTQKIPLGRHPSFLCENTKLSTGNTTWFPLGEHHNFL